jgi:hypothetical protein
LIFYLNPASPKNQAITQAFYTRIYDSGGCRSCVFPWI